MSKADDVTRSSRRIFNWNTKKAQCQIWHPLSEITTYASVIEDYVTATPVENIVFGAQMSVVKTHEKTVTSGHSNLKWSSNSAKESKK